MLVEKWADVDKKLLLSYLLAEVVQ